MKLDLLHEASNGFSKILYHATPLDASVILKTGLNPKYSQSPQPAIYLATEPELAMMTAEGRHGTIKLTLIAIKVDENVKLHPDDDVFIYPEVLPSEDILNKLYKTADNTPASYFIKQALESELEENLSKHLTINLVEFNYTGSLGNAIYYESIGFSGSPKIVDIGSYVDKTSYWILKNSFKNTMPNKLQRV